MNAPTAGDTERFPELKPNEVAVGIDLGTTNSVVAVWSNEKLRAKVVKVEGKNKTLPSIVAFEKDGRNSWKPYVGRKAIDYGHPEMTVRNVKRLMGQEYENNTAQGLIKENTDSYTIVPLPRSEADTLKPSKLMVEIKDDQDSRRLFPEDVSAFILGNLKTTVELAIEGAEAKYAVITVPAHFNHSQRLATLEAAHVAGFAQARLISEPTAAAVAYGLSIAGEKNVFIFDLGGGTFDTSILKIQQGKIDVLSTVGDPRLGGNDVDNLVLSHVLTSLVNRVFQMKSSCSIPGLVKAKEGGTLTVKEGCDTLGLARESRAFAEIVRACEHAKVELSRHEKTTVEIDPFVCSDLKCNVGENWGNGQKKPLRVALGRRELEAMMKPLLSKCRETVLRALKDVNFKPGDIDEIVMVGGASRTPAVVELVRSIFHGKALCAGINPDQVVAEGAAIRAAMLSGVDNELLNDVLMMDVLPTSIGLEAADGAFVPLLPRLSKIPCKVSKSFGTYEDNQVGITVRLFEGEKDVAEDNHEMGTLNFFIPRVRRGKKGETKVEVTFHLKFGGIIHVTTDMDKVKELGGMESLRLLFLFVCAVGLVAVFVYLRVNPLVVGEGDGGAALEL
jgi:molecular chaperone DnaK (HSP70)